MQEHEPQQACDYTQIHPFVQTFGCEDKQSVTSTMERSADWLRADHICVTNGGSGMQRQSIRKERPVSNAIVHTIRLLPSGNFPLRRIGISICLLMGGGLLFTMYLSLSRTVVYNSDNASILLQAQAMLQGNLLLRGWYLPTDNWLTLEIPLYALGLLFGFSLTSLLHGIPALLYTLVVLVGGYLSSLLLQGKQRVWGWLALLGIVAFPPLDMVQRLLVGPIHVSTVLFTLLGLIAYYHSLKGKQLAFPCVLLLTILLIVGDPFALVFFVIPLLLTEGSRLVMSRRLAWRANFRLYSVVLAIVVAFGLRKLTDLAGEHNLLTAGFLLTSLPGMVSNAASAIVSLFVIFHANLFALSPLSDPSIILNAMLLVTLVYALLRWCIRSLVHPTTEETKTLSVLIWGSLGIVSSFTLSTLGGAAGMRYLFPLLFFGGVGSFALLRPFCRPSFLSTLLILILVVNATTCIFACVQAPTAVAPEAQLTALLQEKHLTHGLGTYWVSPIVTVQSEGRVVIRQVQATNEHIHPFLFLADQQWFERSHLQKATFIVYMDRDDSQAYYQASVHSFGFPDRSYRIGKYTVLSWNTPLLSHLQPGYSFWAG